MRPPKSHPPSTARKTESQTAFHAHHLRHGPTEPSAADEIEHVSPRKLSPYSRNARQHSKKQIEQVAESIKRFGFTAPVLIDEDDAILAGHARIEAAKLLKLRAVPCRRLLNLSAVLKRAYILADNKLTLNATWDEGLLAGELQGLVADGFDVSLAGFSFPEIDSLIESLVPEEPGAPEDDVLPASVAARCKPGDLFALGPHRLICGNALDRAIVKALMGGEVAHMVFTDPPWNLPAESIGGKGKVKHRDFAMAHGEMSRAQFTEFLRTAFSRLVEVSADGSIHFLCIDWRHLREMLDAGEAVYSELKNLIVWAKDNGGMGSFYRSRHELIFAFRHGSAPHTNNFKLGETGRYRTNVWSYKGANSFGANRMADLKLHPNSKPVQMIADAVKDVSQRGAIVLDLFGGSGSTLIAAHKTGRRAYLCEIDPTYCDRILARWEAYAKDDARLNLHDYFIFDEYRTLSTNGGISLPRASVSSNSSPGYQR
jgi:DNA modification methylase